MPVLRIVSSTILCIFIFTALVSCTDEATDSDPGTLADTGTDELADTDDEGDTNDGGSDAADSDVRTDADTSDTEPVPPGCGDVEFQKPDTSESPEFETVHDFSPTGDDTPGMTNRGPTTRDHMMATPAAAESWLYPGEYFVIDQSVFKRNLWWLPSDYYVVVLDEKGQSLPFRIETIDDPGPGIDADLPSMDEIKDWEEQDYDKVDVVHVEDYIPFHYTLVIPPWAFPEEGAYNVHTLLFPVWEETPHTRHLSLGGGFGYSYVFFDSHTIYYGDTCLDDNSDAFPDRQDEAKEWETTDSATFVARSNYMFLAPPTEICNWRNLEWHDEDSCLGKVLTYDEREITLEFYTTGNNSLLMHSDTRGKNLYHVMRDHEVIDSFLLDPGELNALELHDGEEKGVTLSVDVVLTDEPAAYQIIASPQPFEPQVRNMGLEPSLRYGNNAVESSTLLLKYASESE